MAFIDTLPSGVDNSVAGRVADIHRIMPESGLFIVGEHFRPVSHFATAPSGAAAEGCPPEGACGRHS